jgi:hypothetical protein
VEREDEVSAKTTPRNANVTNDAHETSPRNEHSENVSPDFLKLIKESLVVIDVTELIVMLVIAFEIPVWWRRHDEVDALARKEREIPCVTVYESLDGPGHTHHR